MTASIDQVKRRPFWMRAIRFFAWLFFILMLPVVAFVIWNRIDEAPTQLALHYATPPARHIEDVDNAWLVLAGIGAAESDDPMALGKRRVEAILARSSLHPIPAAEAAEIELFYDPVPAVTPDAEFDRNTELCPSENVDCLLWAQSNRAMLWRLREANALRLQRFEQLLKLPGWQVLYPAIWERPTTDMSVARLYLNLLALDLADADPSTPASDEQPPIVRLAQYIDFWRRVRSQPQDLATINASGRQIERSLWLLSDWIDHASTQQVADNGELIVRTVGERPPSVVWGVMLSERFEEVSRRVEDELPGIAFVLGRCIAGKTKGSCLSTLAMTSAFAPQATRNLKAIHLEQMRRLLEASPAELEEVSAETGTIITATFPLTGSVGNMLKQMSFNIAGRVFACISIPVFDYHLREHDREALRRLVMIKYLARDSEVANDDMLTLMKRLPESLQNPLTLEPFEWVPVSNAFYFSPLADKYWNRLLVDVEYHGPRKQGVDSCDEPIVFEVTELFDNSGEGPAFKFASCSSGVEPLSLDDIDEDSGAAVDSLLRYARIDLRREHSLVGATLWLDTAETRLAYREILELKDGFFDEILEPVGRDDGPKLRIRSVSESIPDLVAMEISNVPERDVVRAIAKAKSLTLIGEEKLGMERITMQFDMSVRSVLEAIADSSGLELLEISPDQFEFRGFESAQKR